jgi:hypothetical protein
MVNCWRFIAFARVMYEGAIDVDAPICRDLPYQRTLSAEGYPHFALELDEKIALHPTTAF